jgi:hypothetical protein
VQRDNTGNIRLVRAIIELALAGQGIVKHLR